MVENDKELDELEQLRKEKDVAEVQEDTLLVKTSESALTLDENTDTVSDNLGDVAKETVLDKLRTGDVTITEATEQLVDAQAAIDAMHEHRDDYAEFAHKETTERHKGRLQTTRNTTDKAVNEGNEVFYARFRPILEFDHSGITGIEPKHKTDSFITKSYSKAFMVATLIFATLPWFIVALFCYIFKGFESVVNMIADFSRATRRLVITLLIIALVAAAVYVILKVVEFYTGLKLIPW